MGFSRGAVEELSAVHREPEWLRALRFGAFDLFERIALPDTKTDEEWRRTDLKGLNLEAFQPRADADGAPPSARIEDTAGTIRQRGSGPAEVGLDPALKSRGVIFCPLVVAARDHADLVRGHLFTLAKPDRDKFAALHTALFSGGTFLYVPDGVVIERPLVSRFWAPAGGATAFPHTLILAGKGAGFTYMDEFLSATKDGLILTSGSAEVFVGEGAKIGYLAVQNWSSQAWQFANQQIQVARDANVQVINVGLGGRFAKLRMEASFVGPGAVAELKGLFFGSGNQFFDFHTLQEHRAPHTTSDLLFKGALRDSARSVYAGLIRVEPNATRTNAYQANRNLLLSDKAKADSIPMLEILTNDLRCTHGATVGPVDPEHLFYLQSRGIARPVAQRMIVQGFFGEVLSRIPVRHARELVEHELAERIG